ncbi:MAG: outer membrane protein assembly factor BamD [Bdellovibrionales bacterium]
MNSTKFLLACGLVGWMCTTLAFAAPLPMSSQPKKQKLGASLPEGEKAIYLRLVEAYRKADVNETYKFRDLMLKNYPKSIYADNALYLAGLLDYQRGRIAEAVQNFGELSRRYPAGNKRPAALYAKSIAYNKLNLPHLSKQILEEITRLYPGSPESQRAWMDLRLKENKG